jgi:PKHD-type hydroxylase
MYLTNDVMLYPNALTPDECNKIIQIGESKKFEESKIQDGDNKNRSSKVSWINDKPLHKLLISKTIQINLKAGWKFQIKKIEPMQYSVYNVDDHYKWHIDSHSKPYDDGLIRKISFSVILNNDYEGGTLECANCNPKNEDILHNFTNLNVGDIIFFPSFLWHRVTPVTKGIRKSLVGWVLGKPWV